MMNDKNNDRHFWRAASGDDDDFHFFGTTYDTSSMVLK